MSYFKNPVLVWTQRLATTNSSIKIDYPVITGLANPYVQQKINHAILQVVHNLMRDQINQLIEQGYQNPVVSMDGWYELKTNERGILSLALGNYTMAYPSAHGLTMLRSLTCNVETGKIYTLSEMFKPDSNYVQALSDIVRLQIKERDIPLLGEFKGISPEQYYYIADKCLVLYFQLYDITPYVYGFPFFPVSVYEIQDIIRENSPLDLMAMNQ